MPTSDDKKRDVKKVVLAYSGGLDTSIILKWLQQTYGCEVVTFTADLGQGEELEPAREEGDAARHQAGEHLHRGPARGVRARLRVPDVPRQRALRGPVPARHLDRAPADRQEADRDRRAGRGRRGRPRGDRQGQRPGALRARLLRAQARREGDRALARMGSGVAHQADRVRRAAPDPDRQGQARRRAVLGRRQPAARLLRGQGAGGPGAGGARITSIRARSIRKQRPTRRAISPSGSSAATRSRSTARRSRPPRCWRGSTSSGGRTASAGSIWWRTASSA